MFKILFYLIGIVFVLFSLETFAQIPPVDDPAGWNIQTSASEEFSSPPGLDFTSKWYNQYPWGTGSPTNNGAEYNYAANLIETGTTLKIKADTLFPDVHVSNSIYANPTTAGVTFNHQGGVLQSRNNDYKFGYLEIEATFPESGCYPLWPAFWLWSADCSVPYYDEIDISEMGSYDSFDGHTMGTNTWLYFSGHCYPVGAGTIQIENPQSISGLPSLHASPHKYAVEWAPDRIIWYFDNLPVRTLYDATGITVPQHAMAVILNFAISPWEAWLTSDWNDSATFDVPAIHGNKIPTCFSVPPANPTPKYFEINYLHYYKLNTSGCNNVLTICIPNTDYSSRSVEKSISTGGSCSLSFNTSDSYVLRATDYILLDSGTTINPNGSGFFAVITMACPQ